MGPWAIRDEANPFRPGCSYETVKMLVARKRITPDTVMRGPSTRQFWMRADNVPGVANLLGECHACHQPASPNAAACTHCGASFGVEEDRQYLGLAEVRLIPDQITARRAQPAAAARPSGGTAPRTPALPPVQPVGTLIPEEPEQPPAGPQAYEPIRHPARPSRGGEPLDDAQIEALLRRSRADERMKRGTGIVIALIVLALAGVLGVGGYVIYVLNSAQANPAAQSAGPGALPAGR
jgi:hypothetical protein